MLCEDEMKKLLIKNNGSQMTEEEYRYISGFVGDKSFLVFGTGNDSDFWRTCNSNGIVRFLENDSRWIDKECDDVYQIEYTRRIGDHLNLLNEFRGGTYENLRISIPKEIRQIEWDAILVDAPNGNSRGSIGRMQSIFMAYELSNESTEIFVHDCQRAVEDLYTREIFDIVKQINTPRSTILRHCKRKRKE